METIFKASLGAAQKHPEGRMRRPGRGLKTPVLEDRDIVSSREKVKVKVKQTLCRPGQAVRVPGG
jgi:hypothetical protein